VQTKLTGLTVFLTERRPGGREFDCERELVCVRAPDMFFLFSFLAQFKIRRMKIKGRKEIKP
jgi:hypothetical protein